MSEPPRPTLADALDNVRWDYDPSRRLASPLLPTAVYFQDFPWEGTEDDEPAVPPLSGRSASSPEGRP